MFHHKVLIYVNFSLFSPFLRFGGTLNFGPTFQNLGPPPAKGLRTGLPKKRCPAYGKKCAKCGKRNHFAIVCKEESDEESEDKHNKVHRVEFEQYDQERKNYVIE